MESGAKSRTISGSAATHIRQLSSIESGFKEKIEMRRVAYSLLVASLLLLGASSVGAVELPSEVEFSLGPVGNAMVGDQVQVTIGLDTGTTTGITLMSVGVLFNDENLTYNQGASSTTSYLLYGGKGGGGYLKAAVTCGGYGGATAGDGCIQWIGDTDPSGLAQVNLDFASVDLMLGTQNTGTGILLATLVFDVVKAGADGTEDLILKMTSANVVGAPGGNSYVPTLNNSGVWQAGVIVVPEPALASLSLASLLALTFLRIRGIRRA